MEHKETVLQTGSSGLQESYEADPYVPMLPQVVIEQPSSDDGLSPPHDFLFITTIMTAVLGCLCVCSLFCTGPALYHAVISKRQSQSGDYKSAKSSSIAVASFLVAAVVFEAIISIVLLLIFLGIVALWYETFSSIGRALQLGKYVYK